MILNSKFSVTDEVYYLLRYRAKSGASTKALCGEFNLHRNTVKKWLRRSEPPSKSKPRKLCDAKRNSIAHRRKLVKKLVETKVHYVRERFTPKKRLRRTQTMTRRPYQSCRTIARALITQHGVHASPSTVRSDLYALAKVPRKRRKGPYLDDNHRKKRVIFCRKMLQVCPVLRFSDECYINTNEHGSQWVWINPSEVAEPKTCDQKPPQLLVWGMIGPNIKQLIILKKPTNLTIASYREKILKPSLSVLKDSQGAFFQQDNAKPHSSQGPFFRRHKIPTLDSILSWPSKSCDLSPIEQVWEYVKSQVSKKGPLGLHELATFIEEAWNSIPMTMVTNLLDSFLPRCRQCVRSRGELIKPLRRKKKKSQAR